MKRITLLLTISFTLGNLSAYAQSEKEEFRVGIKAGWHSANTYRVGNAPNDNLEAFYVGVCSEVTTSERVRFNSALEYFQNGFLNSESKFKMHTLSLPSVCKVFVGPVYGMGGFAFNFKLSDNRQDFPGGEQSITKITETNFFDIPLSLGLGIEIARFQIEAKYNWGLFNSVYVDGLAHKNRYLQVGAAVMF